MCVCESPTLMTAHLSCSHHFFPGRLDQLVGDIFLPGPLSPPPKASPVNHKKREDDWFGNLLYSQSVNPKGQFQSVRQIHLLLNRRRGSDMTHMQLMIPKLERERDSPGKRGCQGISYVHFVLIENHFLSATSTS